MGKLENRTALITGGARGIGRAIALAMAREGANIGVLDLRKADAEIVAAEAAEFGVKSCAVAADVGDEAAVKSAFSEAVSVIGAVDILVNNAGVDTTAKVVDMSTQMWDDMMRVNLRSIFLCSREVLPGMLARRHGRIINLSSQLAHKGAPLMAHYAAAKAAVIGFTRSLAYEVARGGVTVNAICPGPVDTELFRGLPEAWRKEKLGNLPIGRAAHVDEIAPAAVLLACDEGSYFIGATMNPNGGDYMI